MVISSSQQRINSMGLRLGIYQKATFLFFFISIILMPLFVVHRHRVTDLDTPPTHSIFRSVQKKKTPIKQLISQSLQSAPNTPRYTPPTCTYCHCQQFLLSQYSYHHPHGPPCINNSKRKTLTMHEFLEELDKTHGKGEFTQYLSTNLPSARPRT